MYWDNSLAAFAIIIAILLSPSHLAFVSTSAGFPELSRNSEGYVTNNYGQEVQFIFAYSSGHVGSTSIADKQLYCSPSAPMEACKSRYNYIEFAHERFSLLWDNYVEWPSDGIEKWVFNSYIPGIMNELNKNNKSIYFDVGHHNLYFIEPLLRYLNEEKIRHTVIRLRRRRVETALSMMYVWNSNAPVDAPMTMMFKYEPYNGKLDQIVLRLTRDEYEKLTYFGKALWLVDEIEMRWLQLKTKYSKVNNVEIYWESHIDNSAFTFLAAAKKIAIILGYTQGQFDINANVRDKVHIPNSVFGDVKSKYGEGGQWEKEAEEYKSAMSRNAFAVDWKWSHLPKSYTSFEYHSSG